MDAVLRQQVEALIETQVRTEIIQKPTTSSVIRQVATRLPDMTSNQTRLRVLDMLPMAYWMDGDTGMKKETKMAWDNVYLEAGELAVIVPIPENVLADTNIDVIGQIIPRVREVFDKKVDTAIIFGDEAPRAWGMSIFDRARQAGNNVAYPSDGDLYDLILGEDGVFAKVEETGNAVDAAFGALRMKSKLRGVRDTVGQPIFNTNPLNGMPYTLDGVTIAFPENGSFDPTSAQMLVGDFSQVVYAIRQDVTVKILDQAVIQNPSTGEIAYNLPQQDMIALRVVFRMGWALPNPVSQLDPNRTAVPFAYLEPVTPVTTQNVTFTVKDNATTPVVVDGAIVEIKGARKLTGTAGTVSFALRDGTYPYTVKKEGHAVTRGTLTVNGAAVTQNVTLPLAEAVLVQDEIRKNSETAKLIADLEARIAELENKPARQADTPATASETAPAGKTAQKTAEKK